VLAHEIAHVVKKHQLVAIQSSLNSDVLASFGKELPGRPSTAVATSWD
jgi:predicted Zn-dependent protease